MALTRITKGVIKPNENYDTHNINSTGIITATAFSGPFTGVGNSSIQSGIITTTGIDLNGDLDVDGHTELDNVNVAGVITATKFKGGDFDGRNLNISGIATFAGNVSIAGTLTYEDVTNIDSVGIITARNNIHLEDYIYHKGENPLNTYFGFPSDDTFSVYTAGQQNFKVNGTRVALTSPSGTNTTLRLQHQGNSGYGDIILDRQVNAFIIDNDPSNASNNQSYFSVKNKGATNFYIKHDGKVGIGTDNPAHLLHLEGSSPVIQFEDSDNAANIYSLINAAGSAGRLLFQVDPANAGTDSYVAFDIDGGEKLRIESDGELRITGTGNNNDPAHLRLHHPDTSIVTNDAIGQIRFAGRDSGGASISRTGALIQATAAATWDTGQSSGYSATHLDFFTQDNVGSDTVAAGARLRIKSDGDVGIGTDSPSYRLQVHDSDGNLLRLLTGHEGTYDLRYVYQNSEANIWSYGSTDLTFGTRYNKKLHLVTNGPAKRLTVDGSGYVGIGTDDPQYELHVWPRGATSSGQICAQSQGSNTFAELVLKCTDGGVGSLWRNSSGKTDYGGANSLNIYQSANANIAFFTAGNNQRLLITGTGEIQTKTRTAEVRRMILSGSPSNSAFNIEAHDGESGTSSGDVQGKLGLFYNDGSTLTNTACISFERGSGAPDGAMVFVTNQAERLRINSNGRVNIANGNQTGSHLDYTRLNVYGITSNGGTNKNLNLLNVYNYGSGGVGDITGIGLGAGASPGGYTKASIGFIRTGTYGRGDLIFCINDQGNGNQVVEGDERLRIDSSGRLKVGSNVRPASDANEGAGLRVTSSLTRNQYYSPHGHYFGAIGYADNTNTKAWLAVDSAYAQSSAVSAGIFLSAFHQDAGGSGCGFTIKNLKDGNPLVISSVTTASSTNNPAVETERLRIDASGILYHKPSGNNTNAYLKAEGNSSTYIIKSQKDGAADTNISFRVQDGGSLAQLIYLKGSNKTVAIGPDITPARNLHVQEHFLVANKGTNGGQPYVSSTPILAVGTDGSNVVPGDTTYRHNALVSFGVGGHNVGDPASNSYSGACPALPYFKLDLYGQTGLGDVGTNLDSTLSIRSINPNNTRLRIRTKDNYNGTYPVADISFTQQQSTELARIRCDTITNAANRAHLSFWTNYGGLAERVRVEDVGTLVCLEGQVLSKNTINYQGGYFRSYTSSQTASNAALLAGTISYGWGYQEAYSTSNGGWSNPYPNLVYGYHTGVQIGGHQNYQGTRFYDDHPSRSTNILLSVGNQSSGVHVTNTLSKGGGSFRIAHPHPSKKYTHDLVHSFIEGPQMDLIYRGKVDLVDGSATVNIDTKSNMTDGTFVLLNRDVQCFTSNETGWTAVKGSVSGNILTITAQDNNCTDTISWMVVGERQDDKIKSLDMTDDDGNLIVEPLTIEETHMGD